MDSPRSPQIPEPMAIDHVPIDLIPIEPKLSQTIASSPQMPSSSALVTISTVARVLGKRIDEAEECLLQNGSIHETMVQLYSNVYGDVVSAQVPDKMVMPTMAFMKIEPEEILCEPLLPETMFSPEKMPSDEIPSYPMVSTLSSEPMPSTEKIQTDAIPSKPILNEPIRSESLPSTETIPSDSKPSELMSSTEKISTDAIWSAPIPPEKIPSETLPSTETILSDPEPSEPMSSTEKIQSDAILSAPIPNEPIWSEALLSTETLPSDPKPSTKEIAPSPSMRSKSPEAKKKSCNRNAAQPYTRVQLGLRPNPSKTVPYTEKMPTIKRSNAQLQVKKNIICRKKQASMLFTLVPRALSSETPSEPMSTPVLRTVSMPTHEPVLSSPVIYQNAQPQVKKNIICRKKQATMLFTLVPRALSSEPLTSRTMSMPSRPTTYQNASQAMGNICRKIQTDTMPSTEVPRASEQTPSTVPSIEKMPSRPAIYQNASQAMKSICRKIQTDTMSSTLPTGTMLATQTTTEIPYRNILPKINRMPMPSTVNPSTTVVIRTIPNGQDSVAQVMVPECIDQTEEGQHGIGSFWTPLGKQIPLHELSNKYPKVQHQTFRSVSGKSSIPSTTMGVTGMGVTSMGVTAMGVTAMGIKTPRIKTPSIKTLGIKPIGIKTPSIKTTGIKTLGIKPIGIKTRNIKTKPLDTVQRCIWPGCDFKSNYKSNAAMHVRHIHLELPLTLKKMKQSGMELTDNWSKWIRTVSMPTHEPVLSSSVIYQNAPQVKQNIICRKKQAIMPSIVVPRELPTEPLTSRTVSMPSGPTTYQNASQEMKSICRKIQADTMPSTEVPRASEQTPSTVPSTEKMPSRPTIYQNASQAMKSICRKIQTDTMSSTLPTGTMLATQTTTEIPYRNILPKINRMSMPPTSNSSTTVVIRTMPNGQDSVAQVMTPECINQEGQHEIGSLWTPIGRQIPLQASSGPKVQHQTFRSVSNMTIPSTTKDIKAIGIKTMGIKAMGVTAMGIKPIGIKTPSIKTMGIKTLGVKTRSIKTKRPDTMHRCLWPGCDFKSNYKSNAALHVRRKHLGLPVTQKKMKQSRMELSDNWSKWIRSSMI